MPGSRPWGSAVPRHSRPRDSGLGSSRPWSDSWPGWVGSLVRSRSSGSSAPCGSGSRRRCGGMATRGPHAIRVRKPQWTSLRSETQQWTIWDCRNESCHHRVDHSSGAGRTTCGFRRGHLIVRPITARHVTVPAHGRTPGTPLPSRGRWIGAVAASVTGDRPELVELAGIAAMLVGIVSVGGASTRPAGGVRPTA